MIFLKKIPKSDAFVLITVSLVTVFVDLAVAVFIGVIISALVFAWENAKKFGDHYFLEVLLLLTKNLM